jgi:hypothetical protein
VFCLPVIFISCVCSEICRLSMFLTLCTKALPRLRVTMRRLKWILCLWFCALFVVSMPSSLQMVPGFALEVQGRMSLCLCAKGPPSADVYTSVYLSSATRQCPPCHRVFRGTCQFIPTVSHYLLNAFPLLAPTGPEAGLHAAVHRPDAGLCGFVACDFLILRASPSRLNRSPIPITPSPPSTSVRARSVSTSASPSPVRPSAAPKR